MTREIAPAHALYGSPYGGVTRTDSHFAGREVVRAQTDGVPFVGDIGCIGNGGMCSAPRAKGTDFCIGHLKQWEKQKAAEAATIALVEAELAKADS